MDHTRTTPAPLPIVEGALALARAEFDARALDLADAGERFRGRRASQTELLAAGADFIAARRRLNALARRAELAPCDPDACWWASGDLAEAGLAA